MSVQVFHSGANSVAIFYFVCQTQWVQVGGSKEQAKDTFQGKVKENSVAYQPNAKTKRARTRTLKSTTTPVSGYQTPHRQLHLDTQLNCLQHRH